jgi:tRNA dimethylallyltransferase
MNPVIFIVGPTATGKTKISYLLAKKLSAEIISCDSMLFYKEPKIITACPDDSILDGIKHHFLGIISAKDTYSVFDYYRSATEKIIRLHNEGKRLIVCGGSGLYFKALLDGVFEGGGKDSELRSKLEKKVKEQGAVALYHQLQEIDPESARKISSNDARRIIRALEVYYLTGIPISQKQKEAQGLYGAMPIKIFGLRFSRSNLYERINKRVEQMFEHGAIDEVRKLRDVDLSLTAQKIIGVSEISEHLDGLCSLDKAKALMQQNTRRLAKRQITWFKKDKRIEWIDCDDLQAQEVIGTIVDKLGLSS